MSKAQQYVNAIAEVLDGARNDFREAKAKQSECDKKISEIYHRIETGRFGVVQGYKLMKELQAVLRERRYAKNDVRDLQQVVDTFRGRHLESRVTQLAGHFDQLEESRRAYQGDWYQADVEEDMEDDEVLVANRA